MEDEVIYKERLANFERLNERLVLENALLEDVAGRLHVDIGSTTVTESLPLTIESLSLICRQEIRMLNSKVSTAKLNNEHDEKDLRLQIDIAEQAILELQKDTFEFKQEVVIGSMNPKTGDPISEQVIKYFENKLINQSSRIKELFDKAHQLKSKILKANKKLESAGTDYQYIDFHQLQIQSQHLTRQSEETRSELSAVRSKFRTVSKNLIDLQAAKKDVESSITSVSSELTILKENLVKYLLDIKKVKADRNLALKEVEDLKNLKAKMSFKHEEMFDAMKLIQQQVQIQALNRSKKVLERKMEISRGPRTN
jgi:chromosome segregation ATPase